MIIYIKVLTAVLLLSLNSGFSQYIPLNNKVFSNGETLVYKVKWSFIRLGTITINTIADQNDPNLVKVTMLIESSPTLFFININEYNETIIDKRTCTTISYYGDHRNRSDRLLIYSSFDEDTQTCVFSIFDDVKKKHTKIDTIYYSTKYVDGPSLFFFTRVYSKSGVTHNIPTLIDGSIENTKLIFTEKREKIEVEAFSVPVLTRKYYGTAEWEGGTSQGLSGEFLGYITDDDAAILVYAEVKVLLGKLKIELESFYRNDGFYKTEKISNK